MINFCFSHSLNPISWPWHSRPAKICASTSPWSACATGQRWTGLVSGWPRVMCGPSGCWTRTCPAAHFLSTLTRSGSWVCQKACTIWLIVIFKKIINSNIAIYFWSENILVIRIFGLIGTCKVRQVFPNFLQKEPPKYHLSGSTFWCKN